MNGRSGDSQQEYKSTNGASYGKLLEQTGKQLGKLLGKLLGKPIGNRAKRTPRDGKQDGGWMEEGVIYTSSQKPAKWAKWNGECLEEGFIYPDMMANNGETEQTDDTQEEK